MHRCSRFRVLGSRFAFTFGSRVSVAFVVATSAFVSVAVTSIAAAQTSHADLIVRVGDYVERYYARAQTIIATETVTVQPVTESLEAVGPSRRVVNEVRSEWDAQGAQPRSVRQLISAGGARFGPGNQADCLDQRSFTLEPLSFLLPSNRDDIRFTVGRLEMVAGSRVQRIDYEPRVVEPPRIRWNGKCGWIDSFGRTRGRVWVNPVTGAVVRVEERLAGRVNLPGPEGDSAAPRFVAERADTTIDYQLFAFTDPDELLLLPARVESVTFIRNSAVPRMRVTRTFTEYRRFLTAGRVLP
jgi:hypothetical protein